jgi:Family of unknown function (DUF5320)
MPGGDRTGPMGMGPMTGRAAGYCAGSAVPGFMNAPGGRGFGGGGGGQGGGGRGRRGRRNQFYATGLTGWQRAATGMPAFGGGQVASAAQAQPDASPEVSREQELGALKQHAETMEQQVKQLRERIQQLETEG